MWSDSFRYFTNEQNVEDLRLAMTDTIFDASTGVRSDEIFWQWTCIDQLHLVTTPTLIITGTADTICAPIHSYRIGERLPNATTLVIDDANHYPWIEVPEHFFPYVEAFLKST